MHFELHLVFSVGLFSFLSCTLLTCVLTWQIFDVSLAGQNHCPSPEDSFQGLTGNSHTECALECYRLQRCIDFSYFASSGRCYLYSFLPSTVSYNSDCNFLMNWNAYLHSNCTAMALVQGSCRGSVDDYYGCLTLTITTSTNDTLSVCPVIPGVSMQLKLVSLNLGGALLPLPIVNSWIITMQRFDGTLDFNRGWTDYRNGFGDVGRGEFWLGNEKVNLVTAQPGLVYQLRIEVQLKTSGGWFYADYATFSLDSENNQYAIRLSGFNGTAGDSLTNTSVASRWFHGGMSFSTGDNDNDRASSTSCAQQFGAGWWFNYCWTSCLTCQYGNSFAWESLIYLESNGLLRAARMLIKSK